MEQEIAPQAPTAGGETLLVLDDEALVRVFPRLRRAGKAEGRRRDQRWKQADFTQKEVLR